MTRGLRTHGTAGGRMRLWPEKDTPRHLLPRHGEPSCWAEWASQCFIRVVALKKVYVPLVVTVTLLFQLFGVPFIDDK